MVSGTVRGSGHVKGSATICPTARTLENGVRRGGAERDAQT
jgi:hypothetical protein